MKRISAVAATLTTAATLTAAVAATVAPAQAAVPPAGPRTAAHVRTISRATTAAERAQVIAGKAASDPSVAIGSETNGGKYVTVVHCSGGNTPPPLEVGQPGTPLTARGTGPSAGLLAMLSKPNPYKTVYTCTVTVKEKTTASAGPQEKAPHRACELGSGSASGGAAGGGRAKVCRKPVTLNTGYGGMAKQVAGHHPGH